MAIKLTITPELMEAISQATVFSSKADTKLAFKGLLCIEKDEEGDTLNVKSTGGAGQTFCATVPAVDYKGDEPLKIQVDSSVLKPILSTLPNSSAMTVEENKIVLKHGKKSVKVNCLSDESAKAMDYLFTTAGDELVEQATLPLTTLVDGIKEVLYAKGDLYTTQTIAMGVSVILKDGKLTIMAMDGHRIGQVSNPIEGQEEGFYLLPSDIATFLASCKWTKEQEEAQAVLLGSDKRFGVKVANLEIAATSLHASAFDVDSVINRVADGSKFVFEVEKMNELIKQLIPLMPRDNRRSPMSIQANEDGLTCRFSSSLGEVEETIEGEITLSEKDNVTQNNVVGVDVMKLKDAISAFEGSVELQTDFSAGSMPLIFRDPENEGRTHVLLPVRL